LSIRPSYQSFRSFVQHGTVFFAAAGCGAAKAATRATTTSVARVRCLTGITGLKRRRRGGEILTTIPNGGVGPVRTL
jgi:hypothetical protein